MSHKPTVGQTAQQLVTTAALSLLAFIVISVPVLSQNFPPIERDVFMWFYGVEQAFIQPLHWITQFGGVSVIAGAVAALWLVGRRRLSIELAVNSTIAFFLAWGLKSLVARPRPVEYIPDIIQREWGTAGNGFPSGHAAIVTVLALTLWSYVEPRYRPLLVGLVVLVCISRISLGVHAPLDVLGGVCIGIFVVSITKLAALYLPRLKSIAK